jgi:hypothetical protein
MPLPGQEPRPVLHDRHDRPLQIWFGKNFAQQGLPEGRGIAVNHTVIECFFRAEGRIEAGRRHAHGVSQVLDRDALIPPLPVGAGCRIQHIGFVNGSGAAARPWIFFHSVHYIIIDGVGNIAIYIMITT